MSLLNPINKSFSLEQVCSANYQKLLHLVPDLQTIAETAVGVAPHSSQLYLKIIDRSPYTLTVELSHCFDKIGSQQLLPAIIIRLYLDAQMAEVLSDHAHESVAQAFDHFGFSKAIMDYKWRLNYFLQKWLEHCLKQEYLFTVVNTKTRTLA